MIFPGNIPGFFTVPPHTLGVPTNGPPTNSKTPHTGTGWRVSYIHTNVMPPCSCGVVERAALVTNAKSKRTTLDTEPRGGVTATHGTPAAAVITGR